MALVSVACGGAPVTESGALPRAEGAISLACRRDPHTFPTGRYFPSHEFKMALGAASSDREWIEAQVAPDRCYFTGVLAAYEEPALPDGSDEAYRLIWDRSFHSPVVVRIEKRANQYEATITRDSRDGERGGSVDARTVEIGADAFRSVQRLIDKAGCWNSDHDCSGAQADPRSRNKDPYTSILIVDGTDWVLEGARGKEHWAVFVHAPTAGPFRDAGAAIARAAGLDMDRSD